MKMSHDRHIMRIRHEKPIPSSEFRKSAVGLGEFRVSTSVSLGNTNDAETAESSIDPVSHLGRRIYRLRDSLLRAEFEQRVSIVDDLIHQRQALAPLDRNASYSVISTRELPINRTRRVRVVTQIDGK